MTKWVAHTDELLQSIEISNKIISLNIQKISHAF
jgi:hypothetical protein